MCLMGNMFAGGLVNMQIPLAHIKKITPLK